MNADRFIRTLLSLGYSRVDALRMADECDYDDRAAVVALMTENHRHWDF